MAMGNMFISMNIKMGKHNAACKKPIISAAIDTRPTIAVLSKALNG